MKTTRRFAGRYFVRAGAWRLGAGETRAGVRAGGEPGRPAVAVVVYRPNGEEGYPDVEVRVGIRPGKTPGEACGRVPSDGAARPPARIDGREFSVSDLSDAGMSQYVRGESYRAFRDGACYAVERFVTDTDLPPDGREREKREADAVAESYYRKTKEIVESFRLLPGRARGTGRR
jgi:hypothetical protein